MTQEPVQIAIKSEKGNVILAFNRNVDYIEMEPENALAIAEAITNQAFECKEGVLPVGETLKASLVEKHREKLSPRITLMLSGMDALSNGQKSLKIVDAMCSEVFS